MKMLHLTLKKAAFDVMVTGEKTEEYRKPSKWIESRIWDRHGAYREYDCVKFTNGYGKDKPYFIAEFNSCNRHILSRGYKLRYSNGLRVEVKPGDYCIHLGKIIEKRL